MLDSLVRLGSGCRRSVGSRPISVLERREIRRFADEDGTSGDLEVLVDDLVLSGGLSRSDEDGSRRRRDGVVEGVLLVGEVGVRVLSSDMLRERGLATETVERSASDLVANSSSIRTHVF